jgi:hypothetical protein
MRLPFIYIANSDLQGKGVFTPDAIPAETIVEIAPVLVLPLKDRALIDQTLLHDYIFEWGHQKEACAMALGWIPLYNHAVPSNCEYFMDFDAGTMFVKTVRGILPGEELLVNYNGDFDDTSAVWFEV